MKRRSRPRPTVIAACLVAGLALAPAPAQAQRTAGRLLAADAVLLTGLALATLVVLAQHHAGSPQYRQAIDKLRFHMRLHFIAGVPVVTAALRSEAAKDPTRTADVRQVAIDLGLNPDTVAPSTAVAAPDSDAVEKARADAQARTLSCSCRTRITYRGDRPGRPPQEIFMTGFPTKGTNPSLFEHAQGRRGDSFYVATSKLWEIAHGFAQANGNVFTICTLRGLDVNLLLGPKSPFPEQEEVAVPAGIWSGEIVGAVTLKATVPTSYEPNPDFACR